MMADYVVLERQPKLSDGLFPRRLNFTRQRVYIFLTRQGLIFLVMQIVMLLGAVNYNNSMSYILTFLLSSLYMVCMLHTYRNLRGLILSTPATRPIFAGETALFPLLVDNRTGQSRISLDIVPYPKHRNKEQPANPVNATLTVNVAAGELQGNKLPVPTYKRGIKHLGRIRISSTYPLGLFRAWAYVETGQSCTVYPKPEGKTQLPIFSLHDSEEQLGAGTGTDDFTGFKPYRPGDSIRKIDWKALAREQGLLVKRFSGSGTNKLVIHWDHCSHLHNTEQRLSQLCLWVIEAERQGFHYSLDIPGSYISLGNSESHKHQCLRSLATYEITDNKPKF